MNPPLDPHAPGWCAMISVELGPPQGERDLSKPDDRPRPLIGRVLVTRYRDGATVSREASPALLAALQADLEALGRDE